MSPITAIARPKWVVEGSGRGSRSVAAGIAERKNAEVNKTN